ncbi:hypothetical protein [Clostridium sp. TF11-13AC]|uniref:hypothetical protein n=1 Tax=Clostridium sp. TF11-13AC TaxID=2293053 RepID=UPI000E53BFD4|nr:hypothetical protein [Clostridium sp. TF11-13AC]RHU44988.1 hypothetical protein DXD12_05140 [Clostridium sp. TF11-13AC]
MVKDIYNDVSILVVGYDGYIDVWNHFFELMNKYWKDRPSTYLATSELEPSYDNVHVVPAGKNTEWSKRALAGLEKIKTPYVILMLEDFFISDYVDNKIVKSCLEMVEQDKIKFYQILVQLVKQTWEKGKPYKGNKHIHIVPIDKKYGLNLQAAIWETDFLKKKIGNENYNAWKFEMNQLDNEKYNEKRIEYLIDDRNILNITHTIVQSRYLRGAIKKMENIGHHIDLNEREMLSKKEDFKYNLKLFMYSLTPKILTKPAKAIGKLFKIDFVTDRLSK